MKYNANDIPIKGGSQDSFRFLSHYGTPGMKWGVRRFQNEDGSLKAAGKGRYDGEAMPKSQLGKVKAIGDKVHGALYNDTGRKWNKDVGYYHTEEFKGKTAARNAANKVSKAIGLDAKKDLNNANRKLSNAQDNLNKQYREDAASSQYEDLIGDSEYATEEEKERAKKRRKEEHMKTLMSEVARDKAESNAQLAAKRYAKTPLGKLSSAKSKISKGYSSVMKFLKKKK